MNDIEVSQELTLEDRLKAIAYQFIKLYERWSEDRQESVKQCAEVDELVSEFTEQVDNLRNIEEKIIGGVRNSIRNETKDIAAHVGKTIGDFATREAEMTVRELHKIVVRTENLLSWYQSSLSISNLRVIVMIILSAFFTSILTVWFLAPKSTLPLTEKQIGFLNSGFMMDRVWPKLTKKEQDHWIALADTIQHNKN